MKRTSAERIGQNEELAEFIGIMLGDGNIYINKKYGTYQIRVACHEHDEKNYLFFVKQLMEKLFGIEAYFKHHSDKNTKSMYACTSKRRIVEKVMTLGLPAGNKVKHNVGIPHWIMQNEELMKACIRGLFDTDGSVAPKTPTHPCVSIWYKSAIPQLREDVSYCLMKLGFHPSKWAKTGTPRVKQLCLGKQEEVIRFYNTIGFNNKKHRNRFLQHTGSRGVVRSNIWASRAQAPGSNPGGST